MKKLILTTLLIVIVFVVPLFAIKIKKVTCETQYGACSEALTKSLSTVAGKRLIFGKNEIKKILNKNVEISGFSTQLKLPSNLVVYVVVKKPQFAVKNEKLGKIGLVDNDGKLIAFVNNSNLPTVISDNDFGKIGESISKNQFYSLKIISGINKMYQVNTGKLDGNILTISLDDGISVIFDASDENSDYAPLLGALRLIKSKLESNNENKYSVIDMRYSNPVLR